MMRVLRAFVVGFVGSVDDEAEGMVLVVMEEEEGLKDDILSVMMSLKRGEDPMLFLGTVRCFRLGV
jgi:hypothetical protein